MKVVVQRVSQATVQVADAIVGQIGTGLLLLVGFEAADTKEDLQWMASKLVQMRIFSDENGLMNRSVQDINGELLVVSQFTLHASTKKGNRPSFIQAARPEQAIPLYEAFKQQLADLLGRAVACGIFGATMQVQLTNDGPVTIVIDSKDKV
ncbi:MAG: D-aminoacyl-tRNA deacylase [Sphingobacteriaceae bacterium]|nr:D-aminoacyl-tRNA deacylase [Sphingobacteriaceae bacterium]